MAEIEQTTVIFFGWACDKRGCAAEWRLDVPEEGKFASYRNPMRARAMEDGWSFWVSRSSHVFCPDHGPSRGSKMWQS